MRMGAPYQLSPLIMSAKLGQRVSQMKSCSLCCVRRRANSDRPCVKSGWPVDRVPTAKRSTLGVILDPQLLPPKSLAADTHLEDGGAIRIELELRGYPLDSDDSHPAGPIETSRSRSA